MTTRARFEGCVLGLAVGDALGFPAEFRRRDAIVAAFPPAGLTGFVALHDPRWPPRPIIVGKRHPPGTVSDDTQMTVALAEGLLDVAPDAGLDETMEAVGRRFVAWARSPDNDRAPGGTCMQGCENLEAGVPWRAAGVAASKGCGSAMRVAPLGLLFAGDRSRLLQLARASARLTHGHDAAVEGAAAAALLVALALGGASEAELLAALKAECAPRSPDFAACLARYERLRAAPPELALSERGIGEGWVAEEAVLGALYCFARSPGDFGQTVTTAANTDGDSDSLACIAGGISGAFNGVEAIPRAWREGVEGGAGLLGLAARLHARAR